MDLVIGIQLLYMINHLMNFIKDNFCQCECREKRLTKQCGIRSNNNMRREIVLVNCVLKVSIVKAIECPLELG